MNSTQNSRYKFRIMPSGGTDYEQYCRYQNDFFHQLNLNLIKTRKNRFLFPNKAKLQAPKNFARNKDPMMETVHLQYSVYKNNQYLFNRIFEINNRPSTIPFKRTKSFIDKQKKYNLSIRQLKVQKIQEDNFNFSQRLFNIHSPFNHEKLEKQYKEKKRISQQLRKIHPLTLNSSSKTIVHNYSNTLKSKEEQFPIIHIKSNTNLY